MNIIQITSAIVMLYPNNTSAIFQYHLFLQNVIIKNLFLTKSNDNIKVTFRN